MDVSCSCTICAGLPDLWHRYAQQVEKEIQVELEKKKNIPLVEHIDNLIKE
jgi:hypothetical protein